MKILIVVLLLSFTTVEIVSQCSFADEASTEAKPEKKRHRDRIRTDKKMRSRLTSDDSEEKADRRVLEPIAMGIDKIVDLETDDVTDSKNITSGNTSVAAVGPIFNGAKIKQLVIKGTGEGETNITIRKKTGEVLIIFEVTVAKQNIVRILSDLKKSLREVEGLEIKIEGNRVVLEGEVLTPSDYGRIANVLNTGKLYEEVVLNRVTMSPVSMGSLAKKIELDLQVFAPNVHVTVLNGRFILEGSVESEAIKSRCNKRAEWFLPTAKVTDPINKDQTNIEKNEKPLQIVQNDIQVTPAPPKRESKLVRLTIYFVELSKDFSKIFGFKWAPGFTSDPSISIGASPTGSTSTSSAGGFSFAGTISSLFPALASAQNAGYGRVVKSVVGIVKSNEDYHVKDTQQLPTVTVTQAGATANGTAQTVGLDLKVTPIIMQGQDVELGISMSQANIVGKGLGGAAIVANHDIATRIYLKSGEVSAITAVNNQDVSTSFNRDDPRQGGFATGSSSASGSAAQTIPLIPPLMRSKNYSKKRGQFVVFISPQVVESAAEATEDLKKNYRMPSSQ